DADDDSEADPHSDDEWIFETVKSTKSLQTAHGAVARVPEAVILEDNLDTIRPSSLPRARPTSMQIVSPAGARPPENDAYEDVLDSYHEGSAESPRTILGAAAREEGGRGAQGPPDPNGSPPPSVMPADPPALVRRATVDSTSVPTDDLPASSDLPSVRAIQFPVRKISAKRIPPPASPHASPTASTGTSPVPIRRAKTEITSPPPRIASSVPTTLGDIRRIATTTDSQQHLHAAGPISASPGGFPQLPRTSSMHHAHHRAGAAVGGGAKRISHGQSSSVDETMLVGAAGSGGPSVSAGVPPRRGQSDIGVGAAHAGAGAIGGWREEPPSVEPMRARSGSASAASDLGDGIVKSKPLGRSASSAATQVSAIAAAAAAAAARATLLSASPVPTSASPSSGALPFRSPSRRLPGAAGPASAGPSTSRRNLTVGPWFRKRSASASVIGRQPTFTQRDAYTLAAVAAGKKASAAPAAFPVALARGLDLSTVSEREHVQRELASRASETLRLLDGLERAVQQM
ncbi:hypothetical protein BDK51DRAFT_38597, partial [Blyttiomyces helicus]